LYNRKRLPIQRRCDNPAVIPVLIKSTRGAVFSELELIGRLGTQSVFIDWEAVYTALLPRVYNYFRFQGLEDGLAEELTAQTFEKAWRKRASYRHDLAAFSTWVLRIAHNVAVDYYRRGVVEITLDEVEAHSQQAGPEEQLVERDDLDHLRELLAALPPRERDLIALKYGCGMTNRAIAQQTGLSETNVGTILYRVVIHLRERWER
jgi:RNA polymerase sigma-70 factor (ECF subfamily)